MSSTVYNPNSWLVADGSPCYAPSSPLYAPNSPSYYAGDYTGDEIVPSSPKARRVASTDVDQDKFAFTRAHGPDMDVVGGLIAHCQKTGIHLSPEVMHYLTIGNGLYNPGNFSKASVFGLMTISSAGASDIQTLVGYESFKMAVRTAFLSIINGVGEDVYKMETVQDQLWQPMFTVWCLGCRIHHEKQPQQSEGATENLFDDVPSYVLEDVESLKKMKILSDGALQQLMDFMVKGVEDGVPCPFDFDSKKHCCRLLVDLCVKVADINTLVDIVAHIGQVTGFEHPVISVLAHIE